MTIAVRNVLGPAVVYYLIDQWHEALRRFFVALGASTITIDGYTSDPFSWFYISYQKWNPGTGTWTSQLYFTNVPP